jgi:hypothetical protein
MDAQQHIWRIWAQNLHRWGLEEIAAAFLEAAGPLNLILAQGFYLAQPMLAPFTSSEQLEALAGVLEDTEETHLFVAFLREGSAT